MDLQTVLHGEGRPKFYFSDDEQDISWSCELVRVRCVGHVKGGARCRRNVIKGLDRCWQHTRSELGLKIAPSGVPGAGLGLFTLRARKRGDHICNYLGDTLGPQQVEERYGEATAPYTVEAPRQRFIDGACRRGIGNFVNHAPAAQANCRFSWSGQQQTMSIKATRGIPVGAELKLNYGSRYVFDEGEHRTRW